jgi:DNA-binding LacI/PurR family transcriptional regulator/signal transduction histidine kinase
MPHARRRTIAVLLDRMNFFGGGYEAQLREALNAKCREEDLNLLLVFGGALAGPEPWSAAHNAIYDLVGEQSVDGIIVVSSLLSAHCGSSGVARLLDRYRGRHLCSVGAALDGIPSILLDNRRGMESVVEHMIDEHGCRRLAFLAGTARNPESEIRLQAYVDVLARHGIDYDARLVAHGYFMAASGRAAMEEVLARGVSLDGVVAANDSMAFGAMETLRARGYRVPRDVPVTGFDDLVLSRLGNPPLTTVAQPFAALAGHAVDRITGQLDGLPIPIITQVPPEFVARRSCGCGYQSDYFIADSDTVLDDGVAGYLRDRLETIRPILESALRVNSADNSKAALRLLEALEAEVSGHKDAFTLAVAEQLERIGDDHDRQRALQSGIDSLRVELRGVTTLDLERTWYDALGLVAFSNATTQVQHRLRIDEHYLRLLSIGQQASVAPDLPSLRDAFAKGLVAAGIRGAFISRFPDGDSQYLEPVLSLRDGVVTSTEGARFPAEQLLPTHALPTDQRRTYSIFPLVFETQTLGVAAFEYAEGTSGHDVLRDQVAAALKGFALRQELVHKTMLHERSVQERLATTKRLEALSVLAGGVAHDLNNALGPLLALPDVILDELGELDASQEAIRNLRTDVESIKSASLRAAQTIKDLLTLGRQGRTAKEVLDLNQLVQSCLADQRFARDWSSRVKVSFEASLGPLVVRGAESQLFRAIANLVRNGTEAIAGEGRVLVKATNVRVTSPVVGFENIPPGDYAVVSVTDNGCGIPSAEIGRVFEPFFSRKQAGDSSGTGLGLAIVHGVVKEHEGFLDVTSAVGKGTTFTLYFPTVRSLHMESGPIALAPRGHATILVVDDEGIQLRTCKRVLVRLGYQVETQQSGLAAYEQFLHRGSSGRSPFDLVLMDVFLGESMDGLQILEQIQRLFPAQKAIIVSGRMPSERTDLAAARGLPCLAKPYAVEALARLVQDVLHG